MKHKQFLTRWIFIILLSINTGILLASIGLWLIAYKEDFFWRADFTMYYTAVKMVLNNDASRLYDLSLQAVYQQEILQGRSFKDGLLPYNYPPFVAIALLPFGLMTLRQAYLVFTTIQIFLTIVWLYLLIKLTKAWKWTTNEKLFLISGVLGFAPLLTNFLIGNLSLFVTVGITTFYCCIVFGKDKCAGFWLVLSSTKPQLAFIPVIITLASRRRKVILASVLFGVLVMVITQLFFPWHIWFDFLITLREMASISDHYGIVVNNMTNLKGFISVTLGDGYINIAQIFNTLGFLAAIVMTILLWKQPCETTNPNFQIRFALCLLAGMMTSPHLYPQDCVLLVLPMILIYQYLRECKKNAIAYAIFAMLLPIVSLILQFVKKDVFPIRFEFILMSILIVGIMVLHFPNRINRLNFHRN